MIVFGVVDFPIIEFLTIITIVQFICLIFLILQMRKFNTHFKILEQTTSEIRKYEKEDAKKRK